jgi:signal recognition particle subunit SRP54
MGGAKKGPMARMAQAFGLGGGMPSPEQIAEMQKQMGGAGMPELPPGMKLPAAPPPGAFAPKGMPGLPGLGGKPGIPGLGGGFNPFAKKK